MQKKALWLLIPIGFVFLLVSNKGTQQKKQIRSVTTTTQTPQKNSVHPLQKSIFVPYWAGEAEREDTPYTNYYYFGIQPAKDGSIENELGLQHVSLVKKIPEKQKKIVLRMLNQSVNEVLLSDKTAQKSLISSVKDFMYQNAFSGLILDIEIPFTLQANKKEQITNFVQLICTAIKTDYKTCGVLIYGDFSFRNRPYDLAALGKTADTILLMAYDFQKPFGQPGPNFNFEEKQTYGYDFKQMITDTTALVPKDKIEVVFGMYGYDWTMNEQGIPLQSAEALTVNEIRTRVTQNAHRPNDTRYALHENAAMEKTIQYIDGDGRSHVIWYEDEESAAIKTTYLKEQGIWQTSFWALSYF